MKDAVVARSRFWTGTTGTRLRECPADVRLTAWYVFTNAAAAACPWGLYQIGLDVMADELAMTEAGVLAALAELQAESFAHYDPATSWMWVESMAEQQVLRGRAELPVGEREATARWWAKVPPNPHLKNFRGRYGHALHLPTADGRRAVQGALLPMPAGDQALERTSARLNKLERVEQFEAWWQQYPMKVGKGKAREVWMKLKPPIDAVMAGMVRWHRSQRWADGFIALPTTWLNQKRWEDDPPPARGGRSHDAADAVLNTKLWG